MLESDYLAYKSFSDVGSAFLIIPTFRSFHPDSNKVLHEGVPSNNMTQIKPLVHLIHLYSIINTLNLWESIECHGTKNEMCGSDPNDEIR